MGKEGGQVILVLIVAIIAFMFLRSLGDSSIISSNNSQRSSVSDRSERIDQNEDSNTPDSIDEAISEEVENTKIDIRNLKEELEKIEDSINSKYKGQVSISRSSSARNDSPDEERIELKVSNSVEDQIKITGWRLESAVTGVGDNIEGGSYLPYAAQVNSELDIFVKAGDEIIVTTGRSPIGTSFRLNTCTGYFEQFQDFEPSIRKICPKPVDDLPNFGPGNEFDRCFDFVRRLSKCEVYLEEPPTDIGGSCVNYIKEDLNYNNCVSTHRNEEDFYLKEWRVFLGRNNELWRDKRELIKLIDNEGKVVDAVTY